MRDADAIAFCEVKTRRSDAFGIPAEAVTARKRQRLRLLAGRWLAAHDAPRVSLRFDVASVRPDGRGGWDVEVITEARFLNAAPSSGPDDGVASAGTPGPKLSAFMRRLARRGSSNRCASGGDPPGAPIGWDHDLVSLTGRDLVIAARTCDRPSGQAWYGCTWTDRFADPRVRALAVGVGPVVVARQGSRSSRIRRPQHEEQRRRAARSRRRARCRCGA